MVRFLYNLLLMSISGSVMYLLGLTVRSVTKGRFSCWYYALLVTAAMLLIVPMQAVFTIPKLVNIEISQSVSRSVYNAGMLAEHTAISPMALICLAWLTVSVICVTLTAAKYMRSYRNLKAISSETYDDEILSAYHEIRSLLGVSKDIRIMTSDGLQSPLLFGIFRPVIVIPTRDFTYSELRMIFTHELTHYKHKDLLIKLMTSIAISAHWFNPLVYLLGRSINECCELCCDECVLKRLNLSDKKDYGRLLISVIEHKPKRRYAYTTAMASPKNSIQKRLMRIIEFKNTSRIFKTVSVMTAVSMTICSITAFGFSSAKEVLPDKVSDFIEDAVTKPVVTETPASPAAISENSEHDDYISTGYSRLNTEDAHTADEEITPAPAAEQTEPTELTEQAAEETTSQEYNTAPLDLLDISKGNSSSFTASFTEAGQSAQFSSIFTADTDTTMAVYASNGSITVTDADTGEMVYDGSTSEERTARISIKQGQRCLVSVTSTDEGESSSSIYTYGYNDEPSEDGGTE